MAVKWTEEQMQVIRLRNKSILVSAAAGSGKTAVLVERILRKMLDPEHPVDIDRMLIMTFTRAAAAEMKTRIQEALEAAIKENPGNAHLERQMALVHTAQINTIHGFCAWVLKNYFHLIDLDPACRIADEGEMTMIKGEVANRLMENHYQSEEEEFHNFVECFCPEKTDEAVIRLILSLYEMAMSDPHPDAWLDQCIRNYEADSQEEFFSMPVIRLLWEMAAEDIEDSADLTADAIALCREADGPYMYEDALQQHLLYLNDLKKAVEKKDYDAVFLLLCNHKNPTLSSKKDSGVRDTLREQVKDLWGDAKAKISDMAERYFPEPPENVLKASMACREPLGVLVRLTREFREMLDQVKKEKNIMDFSDLEHLTLQILLKENPGEGPAYIPSEASRELSLKFDEVMVDEYQDSNLVQETIMNCVSGWAKEVSNTFMVGDVKQSIYRFRLARPELFMEKYHRFKKCGPDEEMPVHSDRQEDWKQPQPIREQRIDLHRNFRSRAEVLTGVNYLFRQLMGEDLGGITYDEDAALYPGAVYPEGADPSFSRTEVLLIPEKDDSGRKDPEKTARQMEALAVARRIREMIGREKVWDKDLSAYRGVEYRDIVILLRSAAGWAEEFTEVFSSKGIPSYTASRTGYFSALEVTAVLNYLKIVDNPRQDIPLIGVLRSPMVRCSAEEMGIIRAENPDGLYYDSLRRFLERGPCPGTDGSSGRTPEDKGGSGSAGVLLTDPEARYALYEKIRAFSDTLEEFRRMAAYTPVHQLIARILSRTGYETIVRTMPDGERRSANLSMLMEKARTYEKTSYRGLFNFIRYIEDLHEYEVDFGEVNLADAGSGSVRLMTIHKSKGLEFPVVFVCGMGKAINMMDIHAPMLLHPEWGAAVSAVFPERRLKTRTIQKSLIGRVLYKETLGEELRVLYVALTRAKEKLILTGTLKDPDKSLQSAARYAGRDRDLLPLGVRQKARCWWDFILPALSGHRCMEPLLQPFTLAAGHNPLLYEDASEFDVRIIRTEDVASEELDMMAAQEMKRQVILHTAGTGDEQIRGEIQRRFEFVYPCSFLSEIPEKVSVSDLKKLRRTDEEEEEYAIMPSYEEDMPVPRFIRAEEGVESPEGGHIGGAFRGTAYHRLMECLDYTAADSDEAIRNQIERLVRDRKLTPEDSRQIHRKDIRVFLESPLGHRMRDAFQKGILLREQPFMMTQDAGEIYPGWQAGTSILVQGVIDACFPDGDGLVLADYKTDRIHEGEESLLAARYSGQLKSYAAALTRLTGKPVREIWIYSFALGKAIGITTDAIRQDICS